MARIAALSLLLFAAGTPFAMADPGPPAPLGTWAREAGKSRVGLHFDDDHCHLQISDPGGSGCAVQAEYRVATGGTLIYGVILNPDQIFSDDPGHVTFCFDFKVEGDTLTITQVRSAHA